MSNNDKTQNGSTDRKPNILMIMVDQLRYPRFGAGPDNDFPDAIKQILAFRPGCAERNEWERFFPGFVRLRDNAVALSNHHCASSACVPSRTVLFSGQYGVVTGSTQTDGVFKDGADSDFPWLNPTDFPTIGDWMRGAEYSTHYFGKWHISGEATPNLEEYGFSDWELSYPDPHGTLPNNLGHYRDYQFRDLTTSFLRRQGLGVPYDVANAQYNVAMDSDATSDDDTPAPSETPQPWFAVASFTNPHDIGAYPGLPTVVYPNRPEDAPYVLHIPPKDARSNTAKGGTMELVLNQDGFPQNNANASATWDERIRHNNKPDCQFDYSYKMGLSLAAKAGYSFTTSNTKVSNGTLDQAVQFALDANANGIPFAMTKDPETACTAFMQYYGYLIQEVDRHINSVLDALEESGQADNTIVIFSPDHGEYGGAHHQMMEKWHSAYEEFTHIPVVVRFPESMHRVRGGWQELNQPTSHADLLPTILGLAGIGAAEQEQILAAMKDSNGSNYHDKAYAPVGTDISESIRYPHKPIVDDGEHRQGIFFMTHDTITEPLSPDKVTTKDDTKVEFTNYDVYCEAVKTLQSQATSNKDFPREARHLDASQGPVCGPNLVHAVIDTEAWKLVRYFDDAANYDSNKVIGADFAPGDQFELYDLNKDSQEMNNLLCYNKTYGTTIDISKLDYGTAEYIALVECKIESLKNLLKSMENKMLEPPQ